MSYEPYDPRESTPHEAPVTADVWTSPLWASPDTVGGHWTENDAVRTLPPLTVPEQAPVAPRNGSRRVLAGVALFMAALLAGFGIALAIPRDSGTTAAASPSASTPATPSTPSARPTTPAVPGGSDGQTAPGQGTQTAPTTDPSVDQAAVAAVAPGLVNIISSVGYDGSEASGTGIVLTSDGTVLTNHHVVAGSTALKVAVAGTTKYYSADVVGYDASHDVAVIKLRDASGLTTAPLGDSSSVKVGDTVIGLGNAGGLGGKPIAAGGSVTGLDKDITAMDSENGVSEQLSGLIETDANIKPGDSGGALVSAEGKVIGMVTAGSVSSTRGLSTTTDGYAIPINQALAIAQDIRDGKSTSTNHLGSSAFLGITVSSSTAGRSTGVTIAGVVDGSAAAQAGLSAGDRITKLDGKAVTTNASLRSLIAPHHPGDTVSITWVDTTGASHTADITFGSGPVG